jgi:hypothetical protein
MRFAPGSTAAAAWLAAAFAAFAAFAPASPARAQQAPEGFSWLDIAPRLVVPGATPTQPEITLGRITRALSNQHYTSLREAGILGDRALVVTALRADPAALPEEDRVVVYDVPLGGGGAAHELVSGYGLRFEQWAAFTRAGGELVAVYDDCLRCQPTTFFTAFHLDPASDTWSTRFLHGGSGAPLSVAVPPDALNPPQQVYALIENGDGRAAMVTWTHYATDAPAPGKGRPAAPSGADRMYMYDVDAISGLERSRPVFGAEAEALKPRVCMAQDPVRLRHGQDLPVCRALIEARAAQRVNTRPPAENQGRMNVGRSRR